MTTSLSTHLKRWSGRLATTSDSARLDAEILLKHASGLSNTQLIVRDAEPLDDQTVKRVDALIEARRKGSPIAYLIRPAGILCAEPKNQSTCPYPTPGDRITG